MPARHAPESFTGRFTVQSSDHSLVLAGNDVRLQFNAVELHNLPSSLDGVNVARANGSGGETQSAFQLTSSGRTFQVKARSLQIHERAVLYGNVITLPKFRFTQRALWTLLLTMARFEWGRSVIRRLTQRNS
jgi:hypothetical protein